MFEWIALVIAVARDAMPFPQWSDAAADTEWWIRLGPSMGPLIAKGVTDLTPAEVQMLLAMSQAELQGHLQACALKQGVDPAGINWPALTAFVMQLLQFILPFFIKPAA